MFYWLGLINVLPDTNDGRKIDEPETDATEETITEHQPLNRRTDNGKGESGRGYERPGNTHHPAPEFVRQRTYHRTRTQIHTGQQGTDPGRCAFRLAVRHHDVRHEDAEGVGDAVDYHVAHERGEDHDPSVAAVGRWRQVVVIAIRSIVLLLLLLGG